MTSKHEQILYYFELIIADISFKGLSLNKACENRFSLKTFYELIKNNDERSNKYARAIQLRADKLAEEILEIADDSSNDTITKTYGDETVEVENREWVNRSKLRVDSRKWLMSKMAPKKYGDKLDITTDGKALEQTRNLFPTIDEIKE